MSGWYILKKASSRPRKELLARFDDVDIAAILEEKLWIECTQEVHGVEALEEKPLVSQELTSYVKVGEVVGGRVMVEALQVFRIDSSTAAITVDAYDEAFT